MYDHPLSSYICAVPSKPRFYADRTKRIRDAKTEAQKEIDEYRQQKEGEFKKFEAEVRFIFCTPLPWRTSRFIVLFTDVPKVDIFILDHSIRADTRKPRKMRTRKRKQNYRKSRVSAIVRARVSWMVLFKL